MRWTILVLLAALLGCSSPPAAMEEREDPLAVLTGPVTVQQLDPGAAYAAYLSDTASAQQQRVYFAAFPDDHATLRKTFGYEDIDADSTVLGPYYDQGYEMIGAFFKLDQIPPDEFASKAVRIAENGTWQADGVNYFKQFLADDLQRDPARYLKAINTLSEPQQAGFWMFYTDGPEAPSKDEVKVVHASLAQDHRQRALFDSVLALPRSRH